jgi:hypothetical protein
LLCDLDGFAKDPRALKNAFLWTEEDREAARSVKRRKGAGCIHVAAASTPNLATVIIVPQLLELVRTAGEVSAIAWPYHRLIVVRFPNDLAKLYAYLHECGHVENDHDKDRFQDRRQWYWLDDIEADFFAVRAIGRAPDRDIYWMDKSHVEKITRKYMLKKLQESAMDEAKRYVEAATLDFIEGRSSIFSGAPGIVRVR